MDTNRTSAKLAANDPRARRPRLLERLLRSHRVSQATAVPKKTSRKKVDVEDGNIVDFRVDMTLTFVLAE